MSFLGMTKTGLNYAGRLLFDENMSTEITNSIKNYRQYNKAVKNGVISGKPKAFMSMISDSFQEAGKKAVKANPNLWQSFKASLSGLKTEVSTLWKATNKGVLGKLWGTLKGLGKRMPLVGTALMVVGEIPNVFRAIRDGGIVNGAAEVVKSGTRIAAGIAVGAIASAFLGPIGLFAGYMAGDFLAKLVVGKSHTEKLDEVKMKQQEQLKQYGAQFSPNGVYR